MDTAICEFLFASIPIPILPRTAVHPAFPYGLPHIRQVDQAFRNHGKLRRHDWAVARDPRTMAPGPLW